MKTFEQFYRLRFNGAEPDYAYSWMPETPSYSIPSSLHSNLYLCELDVESGAIVDGDGNEILRPSMAINGERAYATIVGRLFGTRLDIDEFRRDIDALAIDILASHIDLNGCRLAPVPDRRPKMFGPCDVLVTNDHGEQAILTFRNRGVWQAMRYLSPTLVLDPFGAIDPATAATMIRFYPSSVGED